MTKDLFEVLSKKKKKRKNSSRGKIYPHYYSNMFSGHVLTFQAKLDLCDFFLSFWSHSIKYLCSVGIGNRIWHTGSSFSAGWTLPDHRNMTRNLPLSKKNKNKQAERIQNKQLSLALYLTSVSILHSSQQDFFAKRFYPPAVQPTLNIPLELILSWRLNSTCFIFFFHFSSCQQMTCKQQPLPSLLSLLAKIKCKQPVPPQNLLYSCHAQF